MKTNILLNIPRSFILEIRNVSDNIFRENQNTYIILKFFFRKSCRLWDNVEECCRPRQATYDGTTRCMRIACLIRKATNTHRQCVILIAFPLQQQLHERAPMLRYTYTACLVNFISNFFLCRMAVQRALNRQTLVNPYPANVEKMVNS